MRAALAEVIAAGFDAAWCLTDDTWESAEPQISASLAAKRYDATLAAIRRWMEP
ncbi:hypothetical protein [Sorangium sp. So ce861]|uniref:hypothetical protein n=1 Tax=Sorangium sp. So ce861 TaxID=3133323 RepID=UPI003F5E9E1B